MYLKLIKDLETYVSCHTCKKYHVTPVYLYHSLYYKSFTSYSERQTDITL